MSLKEIAEMVGTSPSTVSRVLNQKSPTCASRELQERIWEAAQQIGYQPNESARALQAGKKSEKKTAPVRVSVLFTRFRELESDPFFENLLYCLKTELYRQGVRLEKVIYAEEHPDQSLAGADGVIVLGRCSEALLERVREKNRNIVGIWRNSMNFHVDEVICDGKKAAELAVNHLISLGHQKIAYIGDCSFENRYVGYCNTLIQHGIPINYSLIKATDQTCEQGKQAMIELLEEKDPFTAVFCANDITAIGVLEVLKKQKTGRTRISVISIDDLEELSDREPYLTTIHIPREEMAHMAVELLLDRIRKKHREIIRIEFPCRIVQRDSCFALTGKERTDL